MCIDSDLHCVDEHFSHGLGLEPRVTVKENLSERYHVTSVLEAELLEIKPDSFTVGEQADLNIKFPTALLPHLFKEQSLSYNFCILHSSAYQP
jgi:hypothetical protein